MTDEQDTELDSKRSLKIFGRDVSQIPCFRNSLLYGIGSGIGAGLLTFIGTSKPKLSSHVGFTTYFCVTIAYWLNCRYNYSKIKFQYSQIQGAMKREEIYKETDLEDKLKSRAEDA